MLVLLESLLVFDQSLSMADAAGKLRITQSALSKRLSSLEHQLGYKVTSRQGRRIVVTPRAQHFISELSPVLAQVTDIIKTQSEPDQITLSIAMAEAIMVSWGAKLLARLMLEFPSVSFEIHSHRTTNIIERLARGSYQIGICTGLVSPLSNLIVQPLAHEPMAIVMSQNHRTQFENWRQGSGILDVICIEASSSMWRWLSPRIDEWRIRPFMQLESSVGSARLAVEGVGHALVPEGIARVIAPENRWIRLEKYTTPNTQASMLSRPCSLISRKTVLNDPLYQDIFEFIEWEVQKIIFEDKQQDA